MAVRSLGTQEMGEGFECLKEQNCDPPPHHHREVHHPHWFLEPKGQRK